MGYIIALIIIGGLIWLAIKINQKAKEQQAKEESENPLLAYYRHSMELYEANSTYLGLKIPDEQMKAKLIELANKYNVQPTHGYVSEHPYNETLTQGEYLLRDVGNRRSMRTGMDSRIHYPLYVPGFDIGEWVEREAQKNGGTVIRVKSK